MAEAILRSLLRPSIAGDVRVISSGTAAQKGAPAAPFARQVARENELILERFRSRPVSEEDVRSADLILVMEPPHRDFIVAMDPASREKVFTLREWAGDVEEKEEEGIRDPIGLPVETYREVFRELRVLLTRSLPRIEDLVASREHQP